MSDDKLRAALEDLFPAVERARWPFTVEQAADAIRAATAASATDEGPDIEALRERVVSAMPWYDESQPDYTELDAVLTSLARPAVPALDEAAREVLRQFGPERLDKLSNSTCGTDLVAALSQGADR